MRRISPGLALILALHMLLGLAFGVVTPLFEAPDEANHFLFIRYLQLNRRLPVQTLDQDGPRAHHPPLYFLVAALASAWVPDAGGSDRIALPENGDLAFRYGDSANDHKTKFVHSPAERWPYRGQALAVHVVRPLSALFSTLAVAFTYLAGRAWWPERRAAPLLAASLLAFNPMVLFMSGVVQNSTAALASAAALVYALSHWLRHGFTLARWAWTGVLFAATLLIQTSGLALAGAVAVALGYDAWRRGSWRRLASSALAFAAPAVLLTGWWFLRNQQLYGDWTANNIVGALWSDQPVMPFEQVVHLLLTGMVGRFGFGLIIEYPQIVYRLAWLTGLAAAAGLLVLAWRALRRRALGPAAAWPPSLETALWTMHAAAVSGVGIALAAYIVWFIRGGHGRYLFSAYPSLDLLLAAGALAWFPARRNIAAALGLAGFWLALSVYGLVGVVRPAYELPRPARPAELARMTPLDAQIGDAARLAGYAISRNSLRRGETLEVSLYWQVLATTPVPYTVFVHLYQPDHGVIAQEDTYPGAGNYPTTVWAPGRAFVETYRLHLPPDAGPAESASILVGLYDRASMQRLPVTGKDAGSVDEAWAQFGPVQVLP
jgi:hypothetical protein